MHIAPHTIHINLLGWDALDVKQCLVAIFHFHFTDIIADVGQHHLLPDSKCWRWPGYWVMWGIRFPNYVWVRCKWGRVGAGHAEHVTLVTLVTFLVTQSRSELVIFTWPMHSCVNDLYLHILCYGQDSELWVITCNSQAPGVWPVSSPGSHLNCQHHKLTRHQL